ncbi:ROK family protein [Kutzneria sp. CA-103260]|uniref:ROK family protein n=1 Tax=Kutzneria sp. CA-103260 TaxID=2802641 RepID=UPI001BA7ABC0|nr:ROK family protein [Kutzneria sp. CA-103260]QUQ70115.1 glucokinase [Kutzneria sp. CA-103260]
MTDHVLALDVGGTKIAAGLVDSRGAVLRRAVRPTPAHDAELAWQAVAGLVAEVLDGTVPSDIDIRAVGIGSAGPVDADAGTVSPININGWQAFPLRDRVQSLLPGVPVSLAGDGLCIALGEHWLGAGRGSRFMIGMVVSTGVGGGLVLDGKPFGGRTGNAGHIGHVVAEPDGWPCTCGGRGCVETVAGGPNMVRWAREQGWSGADAIELERSARAGDPVAAAAFERGGKAVGLAIAAAAAICDLDLAVIGGGISKTGDLLFDPIRRTLKVHAGLSFLKGLRVVRAERDDSGLVGAAALVL